MFPLSITADRALRVVVEFADTATPGYTIGRLIVSQGHNTATSAFPCLLLPAAALRGATTSYPLSGGARAYLLNRNRAYKLGTTVPSHVDGHSATLRYRADAYAPAPDRRGADVYDAASSALLAATFGAAAADSEGYWTAAGGLAFNGTDRLAPGTTFQLLVEARLSANGVQHSVIALGQWFTVNAGPDLSSAALTVSPSGPLRTADTVTVAVAGHAHALGLAVTRWHFVFGALTRLTSRAPTATGLAPYAATAQTLEVTVAATDEAGFTVALPTSVRVTLEPAGKEVLEAAANKFKETATVSATGLQVRGVRPTNVFSTEHFRSDRNWGGGPS